MQLLRSLSRTAAALALLAAPVLSQGGTITFYKDSGYSGSSTTVALHPIPGLLGAVPAGTTSMRWNLPPDIVVTMYEGTATGREYSINHDQGRNSGDSNVGSEYNDKLSTFTWQPVDPSKGRVRFYTDSSFGGYQLTRYISLQGFSTIPLKSLGYNDQVDSIRWELPAGVTVMCVDEDPLGGRMLPLIRNGALNDLNAQFGGLHHDKFSNAMVMNGEFTATFADRNKPLDRTCQLSAHNAHASAAEGWVGWYQQNKSLFYLLDYGVRWLQIDVSLNNSTAYMTHGGYSASVAARLGSTPETLDSYLGRIHAWLQGNPTEVLILDFENDSAGNEIYNRLQASPLAPMIYGTPDTLSWPSINELVALGKRVIVFDGSSTTPLPYAYSWRVENSFSSFGDTSERGSSDAIDGSNHSLFLMNRISGTSVPSVWFGFSPNNVGNLTTLAKAFPQAPNAINIDGVEMSDHAGLEACRFVNETTWRRGGPQARPTRYEIPGTGCGAKLVVSGPPKLGTEQTYFIQDAFGNQVGGFVVTGLSDSDFGGLPLPRPLNTLVPSIPGCMLHVSPDYIDLYPSGKTAYTPPAQPSFAGVTIYMQSAIYDALSGAWLLSNGIVQTLGH